MVVLVSCKNEEDPIKNEGAIVFTTVYSNFSDAQGQITLELVGGIWPKFELILAFMQCLVTCKNEDDRIKMKELECSQDFSHYRSMGIFPDTQGQLTPPQSLVRILKSSKTLWLSLLPAKMKKI